MVYDGLFVSGVREVRFLGVSLMNDMRTNDVTYLSVPKMGCKIVAPLTKLQRQYLMHDEASPINICAFLKVT